METETTKPRCLNLLVSSDSLHGHRNACGSDVEGSGCRVGAWKASGVSFPLQGESPDPKTLWGHGWQLDSVGSGLGGQGWAGVRVSRFC